MLGYPEECGGLFVSGGNMANIVGFLAARQAKAGRDIAAPDWAANGCASTVRRKRTPGYKRQRILRGWARMQSVGSPQTIGCKSTSPALRQQIAADRAAGERPILVVGNAGTVSTGAVDPLSELAAICREFDLWFHVDGAYGAMAAIVPEASKEFAGLGEADSIAMDPHKWLYAPLEAGCALVRNRDKLRDAFSYHPPYYHFETEAINYYDLGPQNSRGFDGRSRELPSIHHPGASR